MDISHYTDFNFNLLYLRFKGYIVLFPYNVLEIGFCYLHIHYEDISEKLNLKITLFFILIVNILEIFNLFKVKFEFDIAIS